MRSSTVNSLSLTLEYVCIDPATGNFLKGRGEGALRLTVFIQTRQVMEADARGRTVCRYLPANRRGVRSVLTGLSVRREASLRIVSERYDHNIIRALRNEPQLSPLP